MAREMNSAGSRNAAARIAAGDVSNGSWSFSAEDGNRMLGSSGNDWAEYSRWHLGRNTDQPADTKAGYSYPIGKGGQVYLAALRAIASRASAEGDSAISDRASALLQSAQKSIKQMPEPADNESMAQFMSRCHADNTMMADHPDSAERQLACQTLWDDAASDMPSMMEDNLLSTVQRAYSILRAKGFSDEERVVRGVATTPNPDRMGDIVEPLGIRFRNPMPCLWQHDNTSPIGTVSFDAPTEKGIGFEARLPKVVEPGILKDRVDLAWQSIKYGLVAGASIGFRPMKDGYERMDGGGLRFKQVEVVEMSLVTVPANQDCTISLVKSLDLSPITEIKRLEPRTIVYFTDRAKRLEIIGKPGSKTGTSNARHSVKILTSHNYS